MYECSFLDSAGSTTWPGGSSAKVGTGSGATFQSWVPDLGALTLPSSLDLWLNPKSWTQLDQTTGALSLGSSWNNAYLGDRIGEDAILTNVIGFNVRPGPRAR